MNARDHMEVQAQLRKVFDDRLDRQPKELPEAERRAKAASELDELLGRCWRKYAKPEPESKYFDEEDLTRKAAPKQLRQERTDQDFFDKISKIFEEAPVGNPAAPPEAGVTRPDRKGTIAQISVLLRSLDD